MKEINKKTIDWILRIGIAGEFIGHGVFALQVKPGWVEYFEALGFSAQTAHTFLPIIGILDISLAILVLVRIIPLALAWMALWGFWTALLRPIAGEPIWDFLERFANWAAPLALLLLYGLPQNTREWLKIIK